MSRLTLIERTPCRGCGLPFNRRRAQRWRTLCRTCYHWHRALSALATAAQHMRRLEDQP